MLSSAQDSKSYKIVSVGQACFIGIKKWKSRISFSPYSRRWVLPSSKRSPNLYDGTIRSLPRRSTSPNGEYKLNYFTTYQTPLWQLKKKPVFQLYLENDPTIKQIYMHILLRDYYREILGIVDEIPSLTFKTNIKKKKKNALLQDKILASAGHFSKPNGIFKNSLIFVFTYCIGIY